MSASMITRTCQGALKLLKFRPQNSLQQICSCSTESSKEKQNEFRDHYDLENPAHHFEKEEVIVPPPEETVTSVEESREEWKFVERLIPNPWIPEPPKHDHYPTPSGWVPPADEKPDLPYFIKRTRFHNLPLQLEIRDGDTRKFTQIRNIEGNIWELEKELILQVEKWSGRKAVTAVDEVCRKIRIKGIFMDEVNHFMLDKGF